MSASPTHTYLSGPKSIRPEKTLPQHPLGSLCAFDSETCVSAKAVCVRQISLFLMPTIDCSKMCQHIARGSLLISYPISEDDSMYMVEGVPGRWQRNHRRLRQISPRAMSLGGEGQDSRLSHPERVKTQDSTCSSLGLTESRPGSRWVALRAERRNAKRCSPRSAHSDGNHFVRTNQNYQHYQNSTSN